MTFSDSDKLECLTRELKMRRWVYPRKVREGAMTPAMADREIALIEAIIADYQEKLQPTLELK